MRAALICTGARRSASFCLVCTMTVSGHWSTRNTGEREALLYVGLHVSEWPVESNVCAHVYKKRGNDQKLPLVWKPPADTGKGLSRQVQKPIKSRFHVFFLSIKSNGLLVPVSMLLRWLNRDVYMASYIQ